MDHRGCDAVKVITKIVRDGARWTPVTLVLYSSDYAPMPYEVEFGVDDALIAIKRTLQEVME